jgi:hypothetical protein
MALTGRMTYYSKKPRPELTLSKQRKHRVNPSLEPGSFAQLTTLLL